MRVGLVVVVVTVWRGAARLLPKAMFDVDVGWL